MARNDRIEDELFPFYALDALTDEERAEVDAYVAGNPEARARLNDALLLAAEWAAGAEPLAPSPEVKERLMARVAGEAPPQATATSVDLTRQSGTAARSKSEVTPAARDSSRRSPAPAKRRFDFSAFFGPALGFAVLLLLVGAFGLWRLWQQSNDLRGQLVTLQENAGTLQAEVDQLRSVNATLWGELAARDEVLAQYRQPGAITVAIGDATGDNPAAVGTITMSPTQPGAALTVANLPPPASGKTYQAWLIVDGAPVSAGTFDVSPTGSAIHLIPNVAPGSFQAVGVSLEPAGGSETPTTIVLLGGIES